MATTTEPASLPEMLNISGSSGYTVAQPTPLKKQKATLALGALVATSENVTLHNAAQIALSSGSEISVISSAERQRRYESDLAVFELAEKEVQLAKARVTMLKSREQLSSGSQAGSIGRLADVSSEAGPSTRVNRPIDEAFPPQGGMPPPMVAAPDPDPFAILYHDVTSRLQPADQTTGFSGVFSPAAAAAAPSSSLDELFQMSAAATLSIPKIPVAVIPPQGGLPPGSVPLRR